MRRLALLRSLALLALAVAASGCDSDVPATSADGRAFTIWGQLDPTVSQQAVRVEPISATLDGPREIGGRVVSVDLATGAETVWRDSVITFGDGSIAHVFLADYQPAFDSRVEFRVEVGGEAVTYARVTVPSNVAPYFGDLAVGVRNQVDLILPGAPRIVGARVTYDILGGGSGGSRYVEEIVPEPGSIASVEFGWRVRVDFTRHVEVLRSRFLQREVRSFNATGVSVQVAVVNEEWAAPFPFVFSRDLLIEPGTVSNVRGGYGFLGAAYTVDVEWEVDEASLRRIGL